MKIQRLFKICHSNHNGIDKQEFIYVLQGLALYDNKEYMVVDENAHVFVPEFNPNTYSKRVLRFEDMDPADCDRINEFYRYII